MHTRARARTAMMRRSARASSVSNVEIRKELVIEGAHIVFVSFARLRVWHARLGAVRATKLCHLVVEIDRQEHTIADDALDNQPHRQSPFQMTDRAIREMGGPVFDAAIV